LNVYIDVYLYVYIDVYLPSFICVRLAIRKLLQIKFGHLKIFFVFSFQLPNFHLFQQKAILA